ncbi:PREDICTED: uncharacterized protein LOC105143056 isoform X2 [Acromyrmex echinatior]|uniref:uncharacterized protein LOC105143056 isoform X2 n=1 Tax=Acromyrmex echinatior TaxID=103372 RepID=UPI0005810B51|nr:PREDICTED: uncharacterized protein LOC105143056 isoform X2 [Acromyrmex echinatior]
MGDTPSQLMFRVTQKGKTNDMLRKMFESDVDRDLKEIRDRASERRKISTRNKVKFKQFRLFRGIKLKYKKL